MATTTTVKLKVESNANQILQIIKENPSITLGDLKENLERTGTFPEIVRLSMLRTYIRVLHKKGYIKKTMLRPHKYTVHKDTPFTYTPIMPPSKSKQGSRSQKQ